jgi:hypothetical protein
LTRNNEGNFNYAVQLPITYLTITLPTTILTRNQLQSYNETLRIVRDKTP